LIEASSGMLDLPRASFRLGAQAPQSVIGQNHKTPNVALRLVTNACDKITQISKPYLESSIVDEVFFVDG
jgi:hypothetical protein